MILLLHPTHRKFIKLLRNKVNNGDVIYITKEDQSEWQSVFNTSKNSKKGTKKHIGYFFEQSTVYTQRFLTMQLS